ncbi:MAG TPA: transcriptional repressor [Planctomycetota bacterium]|nr:transcriptional repressor [Planctomycetota bacterium]
MAKTRNLTATERDEIKALLRAAGMRATGARLAVFEQLRRAKQPLTHGEIADVVAERGFDRATVYRNLTDLAEKGFAIRTDLGDHVWRFALRAGEGAHGEHPHFTCLDCGSVECLPEVDVKVIPKGKAPRALAKDDLEVQIKGRCDDCD